MGKTKDMLGMKFGKLTVIGMDPKKNKWKISELVMSM